MRQNWAETGQVQPYPKPQTHFTNDFFIVIQIRWEIAFRATSS